MTCIGERQGVLSLLYVDDEPALLEIGKLFLERTGDFAVTTAPGAENAIEHLKHHHFDAIISDYQMPGMTGIGLLKHLRSTGDTTPFIIFTGKGREEVVIQALNEGADFYIQKGGDHRAQFADLMNKIRYAVQRRHAEQEVLQAADRYKALIAVSNTGAWEYDLDSGFLWCSPEYFTMIGRNTDDFDLSGNPNLQEVWIDLIHPDDRNQAARAFEEYLESQNPGMYENHFRMRHPDGRWIWIWSRGWRLRDGEGNLARKTIGTHIDVNEKKEAEIRGIEVNERLRASYEQLAAADEELRQQLDEITRSELAIRELHERLELAMDAAEHGFWDWNLETNEVYFSPGYYRMLGYEPDEFPAGYQSWLDLLHPEEREEMVPRIARHIRDMQPYEEDFRLRCKDGSWKWISGRAKTYRKGPGADAPRALGIHVDIDERKRFELALMERNTELHASNEQLAAAEEELRQQLDEITATQQERDQSRREYQAIFECTQAATIIINPDTTIALANGAFEEITGWQKEEVIGKSWTEFVCESELEKMVGYHQKRRIEDPETTTPPSYEFHLIDRTGTPHPVIVTIGIIPGTGRSVASVYDITRQKSHEKALRLAEAEKRAILDAMPLMLAYYDPGLRIRYANRISGESVGQDPAQLIGRHCFEIWHSRSDPCEECPVIRSMRTGKIEEGEKMLPDGRTYHIRGSPIYDEEGDLIGCIEFGIDITRRKRAEKALKAASLYTRTLIETSLDPLVTISPNGLITDVNKATEEATGIPRKELIGTVFAEYFTDPLKAEEGYRTAFRSGSVKDYPLTIRHISGRTIDVLYNASVYRGPDGNIHGLFAAARDITTRKRAEDAILTAQRKLRILSGITRHDIQNRIMVLQAYLDLMREGSNPEKQADYLHEIDTASDAIQRYIGFTRQYEDLGIEMPIWRPLTDIIRGVEKSRISVDYESKDYLILGDPMLERVFYNLMDNTIRHAEGANRVTISCEERNGDLAIIWEDNGAGIQADQKNQIFERGFGTNTGFGLFLCREILAITGITIREAGVDGQGARFEMIVPEGAWMAGESTP
ncbi:hybrid sensor histidine kinase/response regulator [Methanocalculus chunghsingensis]|uniref:hybrid sensor histidine kinase/response regulator n=1 Tax=Methanocalculus chunghsingensis TaxID=156457 RepID=UPI001B8BDCB6|nr:PAS domain S-box protein [Methanocalculus chunghsingensis]